MIMLCVSALWCLLQHLPSYLGFSYLGRGVSLHGCSYYKELECKSRKSRAIWSNRQIWPLSTKWSRSKANRVLPRECTGHSKHPLTTKQEKTLHMDITRWSTPKSDWLYSLQPKMEKALYSQQKQDQELTEAQIMNSLLPNSDLNWRK